jgi:hypothetical protein
MTITHAVPITVQGRTDIPYVLMSLPSNEPNLNAVDVVRAYNVSTVYCLHFGNSSKNKVKSRSGKNDLLGTGDPLSNFDHAFNSFT